MILWKTLLMTPLLALAGYAQTDLVSRGKQLTEQVAQCQNCHTPRTATGELDKKAWLTGVRWDAAGKPALYSPDITASGNLWMLWGDQGMLKFLENGTSPSGSKPSTHMPAYRLPPADAEAIVAYLKTLR